MCIECVISALATECLDVRNVRLKHVSCYEFCIERKKAKPEKKWQKHLFRVHANNTYTLNRLLISHLTTIEFEKSFSTYTRTRTHTCAYKQFLLLSVHCLNLPYMFVYFQHIIFVRPIFVTLTIINATATVFIVVATTAFATAAVSTTTSI